jgi:hypothetical protein
MKKYLGLAIAGVVGTGIGVGATKATEALMAKKCECKKGECTCTEKKSEGKKKTAAKAKTAKKA